MIIAGEASGDMHGAGLVEAVRRIAPEVQFYGTGGDGLRRAGIELLFDLEQMSMMGLTEVVAGLGAFWNLYRTLKKRIKQDRPAALVLIDYPELNLPLAKAAYKAGVPVFYFVCPQIWAWRKGRVKKIGRYASRRVIIFPFEKEFYKSHGYEADFVGHPLIDAMGPPRPKKEVKAELGFDPDRPLLLLMPGSRRHLVQLMLPIQLEAAALLRQDYPELQLVLARAENLSPDFIDNILVNPPDGLKKISGDSHKLQNAADLALVTSGTAAFETALMLTPMVVVYKTSALSYFLAKRLVKVQHISIANLIAGRRLIPELIQDQAAPPQIASALSGLLNNTGIKNEIIAGLENVREQLGPPGAFDRAARLLVETMD